jgi:hypothetical protein
MFSAATFAAATPRRRGTVGGAGVGFDFAGGGDEFVGEGVERVGDLTELVTAVGVEADVGVAAVTGCDVVHVAAQLVERARTDG